MKIQEETVMAEQAFQNNNDTYPQHLAFWQLQDGACKCFKFRWVHVTALQIFWGWGTVSLWRTKQELCPLFILPLFSLLHFDGIEKCKYWNLSGTAVGTGVKTNGKWQFTYFDCWKHISVWLSHKYLTSAGSKGHITVECARWSISLTSIKL